MPALRGSHSGYELSPHDEDLQDTPPKVVQGSTDQAEAIKKVARAKVRAVERMKIATGIDDLTLGEFEITRRNYGVYGSQTPVEWRLEKVVGHGQNAKRWTMIIDMDDVPAGAGGNGPDRPHIGYSCWCTGLHKPSLNRPRINGHIFVEWVPASR